VAGGARCAAAESRWLADPGRALLAQARRESPGGSPVEPGDPARARGPAAGWIDVAGGRRRPIRAARGDGPSGDGAGRRHRGAPDRPGARIAALPRDQARRPIRRARARRHGTGVGDLRRPSALSDRPQLARHGASAATRLRARSPSSATGRRGASPPCQATKTTDASGSFLATRPTGPIRTVAGVSCTPSRSPPTAR
jgi:hypothetical protein